MGDRENAEVAAAVDGGSGRGILDEEELSLTGAAVLEVARAGRRQVGNMVSDLEFLISRVSRMEEQSSQDGSGGQQHQQQTWLIHALRAHRNKLSTLVDVFGDVAVACTAPACRVGVWALGGVHERRDGWSGPTRCFARRRRG